MIDTRRPLWFVVLLLLCLSAPAGAQDAVLMPEMVVSARGYEVETSRTPGGTEVLEAHELEELQPVSLPQALDRLPGVSMSADSPWGAEISIRGLSRDNVVLLIDGCRVNTTTDINGRFGLINPEDVERVEVLKGPVSTLYGAGSTGGVVNIITKKGRFQDEAGPHGEFVAGGSTNPSGADLYGNLSYSLPKTWFFASGGWRDHGSYYDGHDDKVVNSQYHDTSFKLAGGFKWSETARSEFQYQYMDGSEIGVPGTGSAPLPAAADVTLEKNNRRLLQFTHVIEPDSGLLEKSELMVFYQTIERQPRIDNFAAGAVSWIKPQAQHESVGGRWTNLLTFDQHRLILGVDVWSWRMSGSRDRMLVAGKLLTDDPTPNSLQSSYGLFAEDDWRFAEDWTLNLGARVDYMTIEHGDKTYADLPDVEAGSRDFTNYGAHLGLTWDMLEHWTLTGLLATSYRAPNILELFKDINLAGGGREIGNPDLDPERSLFAEIGLHFSRPDLRADSAAYFNRIDDYIASEFVSDGLYQMGNVSRAEIWGLEQSLEWDFYDNWTAFGSVAYTEGRDAETDEWLRFIAPLSGLVGLRQQLEFGLWWETELQFAARQSNTPDDVETVDGWSSWNARAGWSFELSGLMNELTVGLNNILGDQHHNYLATSRGFELYDPGLSAYMAWKVKF